MGYFEVFIFVIKAIFKIMYIFAPITIIFGLMVFYGLREEYKTSKRKRQQAKFRRLKTTQ